MNMPWMDGTGPFGTGPWGGRGRGLCAAPRRGFGGGMGFGRGRGFGWWGNSAPEMDEKEELERRASVLERQLNWIKQRLASLSKGTEPNP